MNWQIGDLRNLKSPFIAEFFAATFLKALYMYQEIHVTQGKIKNISYIQDVQEQRVQ